MKLILASGSPRRRELLSLYTTDFEVCVSAFDERAVHAENPAALAQALARGKCLTVSEQHPGCLVVGSDTVVELEGEVFGKPKDASDARRMLRALSGRLTRSTPGSASRTAPAPRALWIPAGSPFSPIPEEELEQCIASGEPFDKAGAYAIQGQAALWLDRLEGDYYTIMGLPVSRTVRLLKSFREEKVDVER